jgi:hypothetical protein
MFFLKKEPKTLALRGVYSLLPGKRKAGLNSSFNTDFHSSQTLFHLFPGA